MEFERKWWKEAVVYQIYPRSFCDSNGDGIGDLKGVISKLDYLKALGVDVLWLSPVYQSPNDDNGYDISDYYQIMDEFGTMADFEELLACAHHRNLKIVMDLVVNHTSDEHPWFLESRESRRSGKRDYYIWREGKQGGEPNNWASFFTPSAWEYDKACDEYYLHLFSKKQPDLNWRNPEVREEIYSMMTWWLEKGIDGFRMDVINCISKPEDLPDVTPSGCGYAWAGEYFMNGPCVHEYLREMNEKVLKRYDIMTVGETPGASPQDALRYAGFQENELNMVFQSELMDIDTEGSKWEVKNWCLTDFKRCIAKWQCGLSGKAWNSVFLGNHDQPRIVSRFGNDAVYRTESAKLLATLLLTLQGTPYLYQGDEIGMTNTPISSIDDCRDIESVNYYQNAIKSGMDRDEVMDRVRRKSRDNARTPMQWNQKEHAGFSEAAPWMPVNPNYKLINAENELAREDSIYSYYKRLIQLRHENPVLIYGEFLPLNEDDAQVMAYIRKLGTEQMLIVLNFSDRGAVFELPGVFSEDRAKPVIGNLKRQNSLKRQNALAPYEAAVYRL